MKELLIESKGIKTSEYFIPAFELRKENCFSFIYMEQFVFMK